MEDPLDLLCADIAVEWKLLDAAAAARGDALPPEARRRVEEEADRLVGEAGGDVELALARRGVARDLCASLPPQRAHEVKRVRAPLRRLHAERYTGFLPLGEGGMGVVYLALDTELNRKVAFKMIRSGGEPLEDTPRDTSQEAEARFLQEAWVTGGLEHPGIVPVYELGRTPSGTPYYTMRVIRGDRTLRDAMRDARGAADRLALLEPFLRICDVVAYAHSRGGGHRDLKPANVALGPFGEVVVLDWGLAKVRDLPEREGSWESRIAALRADVGLETVAGGLGTPGYMAPEALLGEPGEIDERVDIYSLGAILFEILAGGLPIPVRNVAAYVAKVKEGVREVPGAPAGLADVCLRALATEPGDRFQDVRELAAAVRAWQAESAVEREVRALGDEAEEALRGAGSMEGDAVLRQLDRVVAFAARMAELRPGIPEVDDLRRRANAVREPAKAQEGRPVGRGTAGGVAGGPEAELAPPGAPRLDGGVALGGARGAVRPVISARHALEELPAALEALGARQTVGKLVVEP